jgi:hypothetical protein
MFVRIKLGGSPNKVETKYIVPMKTCWRLEVKLHALTPALDCGDGLTLRHSSFTTRIRAPSNHMIESCSEEKNLTLPKIEPPLSGQSARP